ncbi:SDR family oxidoreductase [Nocardia arthritidis]|uniref:3-oxoacyl-[acyl-carrier-protein] reductase MabA n=1 Tax=Nocardia arthritidis TaxID=228602 RepID=A0A6G9YLD0_9NOCA|nr:SDR family oxidoreductase [Nocardia arthritidis]QIS14008.1 SDR family oxidoreductase [Nocardia arthritidis]
MDLGIAGRWATVCAATEGLGLACARALAGEGVNIVLNGRDSAKAERRAAGIRDEFGVRVLPVGADITTTDGRAKLLAAQADPDILVTNNRGPQPGGLAELGDDDFATALDLHYWTPLRLVRAVLPGMRSRKFGRIVNITSAMVTTPSPLMLASAGARAGETAIMKGIALEAVADNVTVNNVLPERIDSGRQIQLAHLEAERAGIDFEEARRAQAESIRARRLGRPEEVGSAVAYLCSVQAGYISGINLHLDGGSYPALI